MELNNKVLIKVAVLLFLMGFTATVDARFDPSSFITQVLTNGDESYLAKSTTTACCDKCFCAYSMPPQCRCADIGETCHSACKLCLCTRSYPPKCRCADTNDFCYEPCNSSSLRTNNDDVRQSHSGFVFVYDNAK